MLICSTILAVFALTSFTVDGRPIGQILMSDPKNFRPSWWHNRDYGVFVANPFGRAAMKQGDKSTVTVKRGEDFRLRFGAVIHTGDGYDAAAAYHRLVASPASAASATEREKSIQAESRK